MEQNEIVSNDVLELQSKIAAAKKQIEVDQVLLSAAILKTHAQCTVGQNIADYNWAHFLTQDKCYETCPVCKGKAWQYPTPKPVESLPVPDPASEE